MARKATPNLSLGVWPQGENPGAGSQDTDSTGLNGNFIKLDTAVGTDHNVNGTHKDDKIGGSNLLNTIVDGTTLEATATTGTKTFRVKDGGVGTAKIADLAVTTGKLADDAVDSSKLKDDAGTDANRAVTTNHVRDSAITTAKIADLNVTTGKLADDAVTAAKISHNNNRTKNVFAFVFPTSLGGLTWATIGNIVSSGSPNIGYVMPRGGYVTRVTACHNGTSFYADTTGGYGEADARFEAYDRLTCFYNSSSGNLVTPSRGGSGSFAFGDCAAAYVYPYTSGSPIIVLIEVEFDD